MNRFDRPIAFTANVATTPHPTTEGVSQLWFPTTVHYNAGETVPLCLTGAGPDCEGPSNWTGLVFASATAHTEAINTSRSSYKPIVPNPFSRATPTRAPPLFAGLWVCGYGLRDGEGGKHITQREGVRSH